MMLKRVLLFHFIIIFSTIVFGQKELSDELKKYLEDSLYHNVLPSYNVFDPSDTVIRLRNVVYHKKINKNQSFYLYPLIDLNVGLENYNGINKGFFNQKIGFSTTYSLDTTLLVNFGAYYGVSNFDYYSNQFVNRRKSYPGEGFVFYTKKKVPYYYNFIGSVRYNAFSFLSLKFGFDKVKLGEGIRSNFLSYSAPSSPNLCLDFKFWKMKYKVIYSFYNDIENSRYNDKLSEPKYGVSHMLSWNISRKLNFNIVESVIWPGQDSLIKRGYDINYLNPFVFFRPVEYSLGSSDNVFLGFGFSYQFNNHFRAYTNINFDEFSLTEIKNKTGWWATKYAFQAGFKWYDVFNNGKVNFQLETNIIRPFTYTHGSVTQNFSSGGQALAHPLEANFKEFLFLIQYNSPRINIENTFVYYQKGFGSNDTISIGEDIFYSYINRAYDYAHFIGQGELHHVFINQLKVMYDLDTRVKLQLYALFKYRYDSHQYNQMMFSVGIKTNLFPNEKIFY